MHAPSHIAYAVRAFARQFFGSPVIREFHGGQGTLVLFSQVPWDSVWQRPQEEAIGLSRRRPVIYISPVQVHETATRLSRRHDLVRVLEGGRLMVISPTILSGHYRSAIVRALNNWVLQRVAKSLIAAPPEWFFTNTPFFNGMIEVLKPKRVAYELIDDFCAFPWAPAEGRAEEDRLLGRADLDLVLAGTGFLQRKFTARARAVEYLPSGVAFEKFATAAAEPEDLARLPRPRLLFVGTLSDRLDPRLFRRAAATISGGSVIVVGPRHAGFHFPDAPSNVHFLGMKPHAALPGYYQHCDLGIMPFADNAAARAINPIKTLEYFAAGSPVLATPIPDLVEFYEGLVELSEPRHWEARIMEVLAQENDPVKRRAFAKARTWDALAAAIEERLLQAEAKRAF